MTEQIKTAYLLRDLSTEMFIAMNNAIKAGDLKLYQVLMDIMIKAYGKSIVDEFAEWQKRQIW